MTLNIPEKDWNKIFGRKVNVHKIRMKDVGVSYEPRIQIDYEVKSPLNDFICFYRRRIIFEKDFETMVSDIGDSYKELPRD